jgi:hypothetical protein
MNRDRFNQFLRVVRWTPINSASALQCELLFSKACKAEPGMCRRI